MNIQLILNKNIEQAALYTYTNMLPYYKRYDVNWTLLDIVEKTKDLINYDIVYNQHTVGIVRLQFTQSDCWLSDFQIEASFQGKGIGHAVIGHIKQIAKVQSSLKLLLKVFKISPAVTLYKRNGFNIKREDERFYYMQALLKQD